MDLWKLEIGEKREKCFLPESNPFVPFPEIILTSPFQTHSRIRMTLFGPLEGLQKALRRSSEGLSHSSHSRVPSLNDAKFSVKRETEGV